MCTCFWVDSPVAPSVCSDLEVMGAMGIQCEGEVLGVEGNEDSCMDAEFSSTSSEGRKEGGRKGRWPEERYIVEGREEGRGGGRKGGRERGWKGG